MKIPVSFIVVGGLLLIVSFAIPFIGSPGLLGTGFIIGIVGWIFLLLGSGLVLKKMD